MKSYTVNKDNLSEIISSLEEELSGASRPCISEDYARILGWPEEMIKWADANGYIKHD